MPMAYKVREASLPLLPKGSNEIKVLHFSDLHLTPNRRKEISDIKSFIKLKPDLVISTGDFLAHKNAVPTTLAALDELLDLPGLFVFGSNDYYAPSFKNPFSYLREDNGARKLGKKLPSEKLRKSLTKRGWIDLNHGKEIIKVNGVKIEARGTDDAHLELDNYNLVAGTPKKNIDLAIGVTHAPYERVIAAMASDDLDLIFAGHTHGGQVRLPWFRDSKALTTNSDLETWRSRGVTKVNDEPWLNVSAGMGTSPFARIRVACPPEVSLITLTAKALP
ncbi:MAG: metallophosphoesterase [Actinobacteria bacterium]|nr:metallophosphoesterase [Actinomycetota bacterium]